MCTIVLHMISFLHVKPSQRLYAINNFKEKALAKLGSLSGVELINTSMDTII